MSNRQDRGSPVYEVKQALAPIIKIGEKKIGYDRAGTSERYVFSRGSWRAVLGDCIRFYKFARREFGVRNVRQLRKEHGVAYVRNMGQRELSDNYIGRVKASLRKLSGAVFGFDKRWDDLGLPTGRGDPQPDKVYTTGEASRIEGHIKVRSQNPQVADMIKLQRVAGLRISEAVYLRGDGIDVKRCTITVRGKGGKVRTIQLGKKQRNFLGYLKQRATANDGYCFRGRGSGAKKAQNTVAWACKVLGIRNRGTHAFRKLFAQIRYRNYRAQGRGDGEARRSLARDLGHNRISVTYRYVGRES